MKSPYSRLIKIIREQAVYYNPPTIQIGEIISPPPVLKIRVGDLQLDKDDVLIADYLLADYTREYKTSSDKINWSTSNYIKWVDTLKQGDLVALLATADKQTFIVLCKVVKL